MTPDLRKNSRNWAPPAILLTPRASWSGVSDGKVTAGRLRTFQGRWFWPKSVSTGRKSERERPSKKHSSQPEPDLSDRENWQEWIRTQQHQAHTFNLQHILRHTNTRLPQTQPPTHTHFRLLHSLRWQKKQQASEQELPGASFSSPKITKPPFPPGYKT